MDVHDLPGAFALGEDEGFGVLRGGLVRLGEGRFGGDPDGGAVGLGDAAGDRLGGVGEVLGIGRGVMREVFVARGLDAAGFEHDHVFGQQGLHGVEIAGRQRVCKRVGDLDRRIRLGIDAQIDIDGDAAFGLGQRRGAQQQDQRERAHQATVGEPRLT